MVGLWLVPVIVVVRTGVEPRCASAEDVAAAIRRHAGLATRVERHGTPADEPGQVLVGVWGDSARPTVSIHVDGRDVTGAMNVAPCETAPEVIAAFVVSTIAPLRLPDEPEPPAPEPVAPPPMVAPAESTVAVSSSPQSSQHLWFAAAIGTGLGWTQGTAELSRVSVAPGLARAPFHIAPEIGWTINERYAVSLQARLQLATGGEAAPDGSIGIPASGALAGFARGFARFGGGPLQLRTSLAVGGGTIRHGVDVSAAVGHPLVDTTGAGPFLFGPGVAVEWTFSAHFGAIAETQTLFAVSPLVVNQDFDLGVWLNL